MAGLGVATLLAAGVAEQALTAQENETVAAGVYSDVQAARGAAAFDTNCSGCHRADLAGGANGPPLSGDRFAKDFAGGDLKALFTRIATTMPRGAPGSLDETVYVDIVAHVLKENGFPAGARDLSADSAAGIKVVPGRPKPPPPVGDFSYVWVVGCLTTGPENTWVLSHATEPVAVAPSGLSAPPPDDIRGTPPGTQSFRLLDAMAYSPESHKGQTVYVRGLLIKLAAEQRMTISSMDVVAPGCR